MFDQTDHHLESLEELGLPEETRQGYLRVATEAQAVVGWYVRLDESDDPPVYDNNDQWDEEDLGNVDWQQDSASFTNFIFDTIATLHLTAGAGAAIWWQRPSNRASKCWRRSEPTSRRGRAPTPRARSIASSTSTH